MEENDLIVFKARDGINCNSLNANFAALQQNANSNETSLTIIASTALKKDGSNLEQSTVAKFQQTKTTVLTWTSVIELEDNSTNFLNPAGDTTIVLPKVSNDGFSHTVILIMEGSDYTVTSENKTGEAITKHLLNGLDIDTTKPYSIMYVYNPLDTSSNPWYYSITQ